MTPFLDRPVQVPYRWKQRAGRRLAPQGKP